jgi:hypothetical protein
VERLVQRESRSASFGAKVVPSLQKADLSFMNSVTGSVCRAKCSYILQDTSTSGAYPSVDPNSLAYFVPLLVTKKKKFNEIVACSLEIPMTLRSGLVKMS